MKLEPLQFAPKIFPKIWGSESWHIYDRPGDSAVVAQGQFKGQTLNALMREFGPGLLGEAAFQKEPELFPLMFKFIDAKETLSVQVHPGEETAGADASPKTEMWVVLKTEQGARMISGLKPGTTRSDFLAALKAKALENVLNAYEVRPGDMIYVPAGRVHAIGKGCQVAELQQNSETTYRVYDYGRLENGKERELHLDQALACIDFGGTLDTGPLRESDTVESPYFKVRSLTLDGSFRPDSLSQCFHLLTCLEGSLTVESEAGPLNLDPGATVLLPASLSWALKGKSRALLSRP